VAQEQPAGDLEGLMEAMLPGFSASPPGAEFKASCPSSVGPGILGKSFPYTQQSKCIMHTTSIEQVDQCSACVKEHKGFSSSECADGPK